METNIKVVIANVNEEPEVKMVENKLDVLQQIVGGYIEVVRLQPDMLIILNEEGKLMNLEPNMVAGYDVLVGNVLFCGNDGEEFRSLTDSEIQQVLNYVDFARSGL